jgi:hypothetical protein
MSPRPILRAHLPGSWSRLFRPSMTPNSRDHGDQFTIQIRPHFSHWTSHALDADRNFKGVGMPAFKVPILTGVPGTN